MENRKSKTPIPTHVYLNGKIEEFKKQKSWFHTEVDFENSFRWWFALQWQNSYMQLFIVGFIALILEIINFGWVIDTVYENFAVGGNFGGIATIICLSIPLLETSAIAYKGFWQFFNDRKHGRSR